MPLEKKFCWLAGLVCVAVILSGCAEPLTLKFAPGEKVAYRVTTENVNSVKYEGALLKEEAFKEKPDQKKVFSTEVEYWQQIESIGAGGKATALITIKGVKVSSGARQIDFDSSRKADEASPLMKLVGQSYTIEIGPDGQVSKVVEVEKLLAAVAGSAPANRLAAELLSSDTIKMRHSVPPLEAVSQRKLKAGDKWTVGKSINFDLMGAKSFERVYKVEAIRSRGKEKIASIVMDAQPGGGTAEEISKAGAGGFLNMFDNTNKYNGRLLLNLTKGMVEHYSEKLVSEWVMVDQNPKPDEEPGVIRIGAVRSQSMDKLD